MWPLIKLFIDICCLTKAPQDIPYSVTLLKGLMIIYAVIAFVILSPEQTVIMGALEVFCELTIMVLFVWMMLFIYGKIPRFTQVLCAFIGTDALVSFLALPAMGALMADRWIDISSVTLLGLMTWHWVICGHIIRHALAQSFLFGLGMSFLYFVVSYQLMAWLFPYVAPG
jgi:hypothetical protein